MSRGLVKRNMGLEEPALSFVPLARLPPKLCWPMSAAVVLQSDEMLVDDMSLSTELLTDVQVASRIAKRIFCFSNRRS